SSRTACLHYKPESLQAGGAERGAPMSQGAYRRVCGAATPKGAARRGCSATATVLDCQAHAATFACHGVRCLSIAFRMINSFRMHAVRATFFAFPAAHKR